MLSQEETLELLKKAQQNNNDAKQTLILENSPLIKSIIKRYQQKGIEYDDLYQLGCIGLLKAIKNFDVEFNVKFSTYAVPMIMGEIKRYLRDDGSIKVSRAIKSQNIKINRYIEKELKENGVKPSIEKIANEFNLDTQEVIFIMDSGKMPFSLYSPFEEDDSRSLLVIDRLVQDNSEEEMSNSILLKDILQNLPKRDKLIILLRYFRDKTQSEIAEVLNISQVQVSRLENKILEKIRRDIN